MGEKAARYMSYRSRPAPQEPEGERKALERLQAEAIEAGATLHSEGRGGMPSSVVLGVLRRDHYQCKRCGGKSDLTMHHKADILASDYLRRLKKVSGRTDPQNLVTICQSCHDAIHTEAREKGWDSDS